MSNTPTLSSKLTEKFGDTYNKAREMGQRGKTFVRSNPGDTFFTIACIFMFSFVVAELVVNKAPAVVDPNKIDSNTFDEYCSGYMEGGEHVMEYEWLSIVSTISMWIVLPILFLRLMYDFIMLDVNRSLSANLSYVTILIMSTLVILYGRYTNIDNTHKKCYNLYTKSEASKSDNDKSKDDESETSKTDNDKSKGTKSDESGEDKPEPKSGIADLPFNKGPDSNVFTNRKEHNVMPMNIFCSILIILSFVLLYFNRKGDKGLSAMRIFYGMVAVSCIIMLGMHFNNSSLKTGVDVESTVVIDTDGKGSANVKSIEIPVSPASKGLRFSPIEYDRLQFYDEAGKSVYEIEKDDLYKIENGKLKYKTKCSADPVCMQGSEVVAHFDDPIGKLVISGLNPVLDGHVEITSEFDNTLADRPVEGVNSRSMDSTYGVELFRLPEFQGKSTGVLYPGDYHFTGDLNDSTKLSGKFNDNIGSIKVDQGFSVKLFEHYPVTSGAGVQIHMAPVRNMGAFGKKVSSIRVERI